MLDVAIYYIILPNVVSHSWHLLVGAEPEQRVFHLKFLPDCHLAQRRSVNCRGTLKLVHVQTDLRSTPGIHSLKINNSVIAGINHINLLRLSLTLHACSCALFIKQVILLTNSTENLVI